MLLGQLEELEYGLCLRGTSTAFPEKEYCPAVYAEAQGGVVGVQEAVMAGAEGDVLWTMLV